MVQLTLMDKSYYFKGLLLLMRKDNRITQAEKELMMKFCSALGFDKTFCEESISYILDNEHIIDEPPVFSNKAIAAYFIEDALKLAVSDGPLHKNEEDFLKQIITKNNLSIDWFNNLLFNSIPSEVKLDNYSLNVNKFL